MTTAAALVLVLVALQVSFFLNDRTPMTWDPSLFHHLTLRLLHAVLDRGGGELLRAWTASDHIYPPLYMVVHLPFLALVGPTAGAAQAVEGLWLVLLTLTVFFHSAPHRDPLRASALALACATSPLLLSLARVTYIENLLTLEIAWAAILARRWCESASIRTASGFGALAGAALLTKWSAAVFLIPIVVAACFAQRSAPVPAGPRHWLRSLVAAALPGLAIAGPWYVSAPLRLARNLAFESFEKVEGASLFTWSGSGFYLRALASELFWLPVAMWLGFLAVRAWRRSDPTGRRFWTLAGAGALLILTLVPHRQSRFAAPLVPLVILGAAEVTRSPSRSRNHFVLLGLAALSGLALSIPGPGIARPTSIWSPARGIPALRLGPPQRQVWPLDEILSAASAAGRSGGIYPGSAVRIHLEVERGHPYLNFWTLQSHAWQAGVTLARNPANAQLLLSIARDSDPPPGTLASVLTPDGYRCSLLPLRAGNHDQSKSPRDL